MHTRTVEQVESWESRPFSGGFRELQELADDGFSGTVVADDTWLFFLNGRVVGVFQGDIDDVSDASGTVYTAPDPALPLLFSMEERGGSTQAKYFTNDTPIEEADETLRDANFTGYIELSENVLSGDYYVVYYGGKSMSAAFIGQSERLVTGEEAFERANDEVGVYEVTKVSMNITEIPAPAEPAEGAVATEEDDDASETADEEPTETTQPPIAVEEAESSGSEETDAADSVATDSVSPESATTPDGVDEVGEADTAEAAADHEARDRPTEDAVEAADPETEDAAESPSTAGEAVDDRAEATAANPTPDPTDEESTSDPEPGRPDVEEPAPEREMSDHERAVNEWAKRDRDESVAAEGDDDDPFREEAAWRKTKSIPALDPDESARPDEGRQEASTDTPSGTRQTRDSPRSARSGKQTRSKPAEGRRGSSSGNRTGGGAPGQSTPPSNAATGSGSSGGRPGQRVQQLERAVEEREERIDRLESELAEAETRREELEAELADLREERDDLSATVDSLKADLERAREGSGSPAGGPTDLRPSEALSGTNLFVRYESKGQPTLKALGEGGQVDPEAINENLRLEHHTQFEAADATVDGEPFETFLHDSARFRFVDWLVRALPYELLESGARSELEGVYEAVPRFDRIEFDGTIEATSESGESASGAFDVVIRDRMGNALVVAEINDSRDPVRADEMAELVDSATAIGEGTESLAAAFYVTASFFEPGALENAQDAASEGGFFSRSDRESFVKTGRKQGYHLCLVEDRQDAFHLTVPEL
ncbi:MAG: hypothetical protein ABEJ67_03070 [Halanaeroarchaeum sp.]